MWPAAERCEEVLAVLDQLERFVPGAPDNHYERMTADVVRPDGSTVRAWVYVAADPLAATLRSSGTPVPGGDWRARRH